MFTRVLSTLAPERTYVQNTVWILLERLSSLVLGLATFILFSRYLTVDELGAYSYALALAALMIPFCSAGLNSIVSKEIVKAPHEQASIMASALLVRCIYAAITLAIVFILLSEVIFSIKEFEASFKLVVVVASLSTLLVFDFYFQALSRNKIPCIWKVSVISVFFLLKLAAVVYAVALSDLLNIFIAELVCLYVGFAALYFFFSPRNKFAPKILQAKALFKNGFWLFFSGVSAVLNLKVDQVMLANLSSEYELGIYAVASKVSESCYFIPVAIVTAYFPKLIKARQASLDLYQKLIKSLVALLLCLSLVIIVFGLILADELVPIIFGDKYLASTNIFIIHILASLFVFQRELFSKWLIIENLLKFSLITQVIGAISNIMLNFLLIPYYDGVGSAVATLISYSLSGFFSLLIFTQTRVYVKYVLAGSVVPFKALLCQLGRLTNRHSR